MLNWNLRNRCIAGKTPSSFFHSKGRWAIRNAHDCAPEVCGHRDTLEYVRLLGRAHMIRHTGSLVTGMFANRPSMVADLGDARQMLWALTLNRAPIEGKWDTTGNMVNRYVVRNYCTEGYCALLASISCWDLIYILGVCRPRKEKSQIDICDWCMDEVS